MEGEEETCFWGHFIESPETAIVMGSSIVSFGDVKSFNNHHQISSKAGYNHYGGGCSRKVTKTFKTGGFVDGRNGNHVYKKEVDYDSSFKVSDKRLGITTHYETQVKHKQTTTYANPSAKSSGGKTGCTFAKPSRSSGGVRIKNAGGISKVSGSGGVECEVVARYTSSGKSSGGVGRGSSSRAYGGSKKCGGGKTDCTFAKPSKSSGGVRIKNAGGTCKVSGSGGVKCEVVARYTSSGKSSGGVGRGSSLRAYGSSKKCDYSYY